MMATLGQSSCITMEVNFYPVQMFTDLCLMWTGFNHTKKTVHTQLEQFTWF